MSSAAFDYNDMRIVAPHLDPDRPVTQLEALLDGDSEIAAEQFVDWLATEANRETLYHLVIPRLGEDDVTAAAEQWAKDEMQ